MIVDIYLTFQKIPLSLINRKLNYYNITAVLKLKNINNKQTTPSPPKSNKKKP